MISDKSVKFLVDQEDGNEAYYQRTEEHWDWPEGESGPTVGVGYDCGYVTEAECARDWNGIVDDATVAALKQGVGYRGHAAHNFVMLHRHAVTITWEQALREFTLREIPKWEARCEMVLPHWDHLGGDCKGALLSLAYNRGTGGFTSNLPRFREMGAIRHLMVTGQFNEIPQQFVQMTRLWPGVSDLRRRRALEAQLFAGGVYQNTPIGEPLVATNTQPPTTPKA